MGGTLIKLDIDNDNRDVYIDISKSKTVQKLKEKVSKIMDAETSQIELF